MYAGTGSEIPSPSGRGQTECLDEVENSDRIERLLTSALIPSLPLRVLTLLFAY